MGPQQVDPHEILGLAQGASWAEIRLAYRRLAKKHHPDKNPGDKASEWIFKEVSRAYEQLRRVHGAHGGTQEPRRRERDPGTRSDYERRARQAQAQREREQRQRTENARQEHERAKQREREQNGTRRAALGLFIVAVAALIATSAIDDRRGDTFPERTVPSTTAIEREDTSVGPPSTVTVPQGFAPVGQSSPPVRVDTDSNSRRAAQSAAEIESEATAARPRGTATVSQAPVPVAPSRPRERASPSRSGPSPPVTAIVDNVTVMGWRRADSIAGTEPYGKNTSLISKPRMAGP